MAPSNEHDEDKKLFSKTLIYNMGSSNNSNGNLSPIEFFKYQVKQRLDKDITFENALSIKNFFHEPTQEEIDSYDMSKIAAIRSQNITELRQMHESGKTLQSCNRFGESLIHMACRRGFNEVVEFLIREAGVSINIRDDYGRTPLHDACWTCEPNFALIDALINEEPRLLFICDARGVTPIQYARKEHWNEWKAFLAKKVIELDNSTHGNFLC